MTEFAFLGRSVCSACGSETADGQLCSRAGCPMQVSLSEQWREAAHDYYENPRRMTPNTTAARHHAALDAAADAAVRVVLEYLRKLDEDNWRSLRDRGLSDRAGRLRDLTTEIEALLNHLVAVQALTAGVIDHELALLERTDR